MYKINDYIFYGNSGVCMIKDICTPQINGINKDKKYYVIEPVYSKGNIIYTQIDNQTKIIRTLISKEEAIELIEQIPSIKMIWISDNKAREETYKEGMKCFDSYECVKIIKSIYLRGQEKSVEGKRLSSLDEKYKHLAEDCLYGELAVILDLPKEEIQNFVMEKINQQLFSKN